MSAANVYNTYTLPMSDLVFQHTVLTALAQITERLRAIEEKVKQ